MEYEENCSLTRYFLVDLDISVYSTTQKPAQV